MDRAEAIEFLENNHRGVLVTRRRDGGLQTSPITIGVDAAGRGMISSRQTAYKVRNLRRDPSLVACVFEDRFFGRWVQVEGRAEIVELPDAMELLVDYYRRISGEHPDWDDYRNAMERDRRVLIRFSVERAGPSAEG